MSILLVRPWAFPKPHHSLGRGLVVNTKGPRLAHESIHPARGEWAGTLSKLIVGENWSMYCVESVVYHGLTCTEFGANIPQRPAN